MYRFSVILAFFVVLGCGPNKTTTEAPPPTAAEVQKMQAEKQKEMEDYGKKMSEAMKKTK